MRIRIKPEARPVYATIAVCAIIAIGYAAVIIASLMVK